MAGHRLYNIIAERLCALIDEGFYPPGSRLPGERDLAKLFDVSRVTIRQAEIVLQARGRLEIKTGAGVFVCAAAPLDPDRLPDVSAFEVTEARLLIESEGAALAARLMTDDVLVQLIACVEGMESEDMAVAGAADGEFHLAIAKASGNAAMVHSIATLWRMREEIPAVKRSCELICASDKHLRIDEHRKILKAFAVRDAAQARLAMRQHFQRLLNGLIESAENEALLEVQERSRASRQRFLSDHAGAAVPV